MLGVVLVACLSATAPAIAQDVEGLRACLGLKRALEIFTVNGWLPGLRGRLFAVAERGARSTDPYLRNAMARLARSSHSPDEMITWMKVTVDVCVNRTARGPSTTIFQAPPAPITEPAPVTQPDPIARPAPVTQPAPIAQPAPITQPAPGTEPAPASPAPVVPPATSEQAAEQHLQRVLEREGATDARCTKKQYGTSWVTVCE